MYHGLRRQMISKEANKLNYKQKKLKTYPCDFNLKKHTYINTHCFLKIQETTIIAKVPSTNLEHNKCLSMRILCHQFI